MESEKAVSKLAIYSTAAINYVREFRLQDAVRPEISTSVLEGVYEEGMCDSGLAPDISVFHAILELLKIAEPDPSIFPMPLDHWSSSVKSLKIENKVDGFGQYSNEFINTVREYRLAVALLGQSHSLILAEANRLKQEYLDQFNMFWKNKHSIEELDELASKLEQVERADAFPLPYSGRLAAVREVIYNGKETDNQRKTKEASVG